MSKSAHQIINFYNAYHVKGPILRGIARFDDFRQDMNFATYTVAANTPKQAGFFGVVITEEPVNTSIKRVTVRWKLNDSGVANYETRLDKKQNLNEFVCGYTELFEVVASGTDPVANTGDVWNSEVTEYDEFHDIRITQIITAFNTVDTREWDAELNVWNQVEKTLSRTKNTAGWIDGFFYSHQEIRCGWFINSKETLATGTTYSYGTTINGYWPAVLKTFSPAFINGEDDEGVYVAKGVVDIDMKDSYNGPCKATVVVTFSSTAPSLSSVGTPMIPDSIAYEGIFFNFRIPECLHGTFTFTEAVGSVYHPTLQTSQSRVFNRTATNYTDWPDSYVKEFIVKPYKGGYISHAITIFKPA